MKTATEIQIEKFNDLSKDKFKELAKCKLEQIAAKISAKMVRLDISNAHLEKMINYPSERISLIRRAKLYPSVRTLVKIYVVLGLDF